MTDVTRTFTVNRPMDVVVGYLRDFAHAEAWDPGTKSCTRQTSGPLAVGTTWRNVSEFKGRETELTYTLDTDAADHLVFRGENKSVTSTDDLSFRDHGGSTEITYHANLDWHGIANLAAPFVKGEFEKLGDETLTRITQVIDAL